MTSSDTPETITAVPNSWQGSWNDGQTPVRHDVLVKLGPDQLTFQRTDKMGSIPTMWSYEAIASPNPISKTEQQVLITCKDAPEQRLLVDDPTFATAILERAPNLSHKAHTWGLLKWPLGITVILLIFGGLTYFDIISPANSVAKVLPDSARQTLGNRVVSMIKGKNKFCKTPEGDKALAKLITRITPGFPKSLSPNIRVANLPIENAFAAPGDQIIISGKIISRASSPDEVAGILAHEIGHSIERHPEAGIVRALGLITLMQFLTAGESGTFSEIIFQLVLTGYSRKAESEADVHAAQILNKTNISTRPLAGFFERLQNKYARKNKTEKKDVAKKNTPNHAATKKNTEKSVPQKKSDKSILDWLSTHPATQERIHYFNQSDIKTSPPILNKSEWNALQTICGEKSKKDQQKNEKEE